MIFNRWGLGLLLCMPLQIYAMGYSNDYTSCMDTAGISNEIVASCRMAELKQQNKRLKYFFKQVLSQYSGDARKTQKNIQKQWFKSRDKSCNKENSQLSIDYQNRYLNCALKLTLQEANALEKSSYRNS